MSLLLSPTPLFPFYISLLPHHHSPIYSFSTLFLLACPSFTPCFLTSLRPFSFLCPASLLLLFYLPLPCFSLLYHPSFIYTLSPTLSHPLVLYYFPPPPAATLSSAAFSPPPFPLPLPSSPAAPLLTPSLPSHPHPSFPNLSLPHPLLLPSHPLPSHFYCFFSPAPSTTTLTASMPHSSTAFYPACCFFLSFPSPAPTPLHSLTAPFFYHYPLLLTCHPLLPLSLTFAAKHCSPPPTFAFLTNLHLPYLLSSAFTTPALPTTPCSPHYFLFPSINLPSSCYYTHPFSSPLHLSLLSHNSHSPARSLPNIIPSFQPSLAACVY